RPVSDIPLATPKTKGVSQIQARHESRGNPANVADSGSAVTCGNSTQKQDQALPVPAAAATSAAKSTSSLSMPSPAGWRTKLTSGPPADWSGSPTLVSGSCTKGCSTRLFWATHFLTRLPVICSVISAGLPTLSGWALVISCSFGGAWGGIATGLP